jgi:hypothetical protein
VLLDDELVDPEPPVTASDTIVGRPLPLPQKPKDWDWPAAIVVS